MNLNNRIRIGIYVLLSLLALAEATFSSEINITTVPGLSSNGSISAGFHSGKGYKFVLNEPLYPSLTDDTSYRSHDLETGFLVVSAENPLPVGALTTTDKGLYRVSDHISNNGTHSVYKLAEASQNELLSSVSIEHRIYKKSIPIHWNTTSNRPEELVVDGETLPIVIGGLIEADIFAEASIDLSNILDIVEDLSPDAKIIAELTAELEVGLDLESASISHTFDVPIPEIPIYTFGIDLGELRIGFIFTLSPSLSLTISASATDSIKYYTYSMNATAKSELYIHDRIPQFIPHTSSFTLTRPEYDGDEATSDSLDIQVSLIPKLELPITVDIDLVIARLSPYIGLGLNIDYLIELCEQSELHSCAWPGLEDQLTGDVSLLYGVEGIDIFDVITIPSYSGEWTFWKFGTDLDCLRNKKVIKETYRSVSEAPFALTFANISINVKDSKFVVGDIFPVISINDGSSNYQCAVSTLQEASLDGNQTIGHVCTFPAKIKADDNLVISLIEEQLIKANSEVLVTQPLGEAFQDLLSGSTKTIFKKFTTDIADIAFEVSAYVPLSYNDDIQKFKTDLKNLPISFEVPATTGKTFIPVYTSVDGKVFTDIYTHDFDFTYAGGAGFTPENTQTSKWTNKEDLLSLSIDSLLYNDALDPYCTFAFYVEGQSVPSITCNGHANEYAAPAAKFGCSNSKLVAPKGTTISVIVQSYYIAHIGYTHTDTFVLDSDTSSISNDDFKIDFTVSEVENLEIISKTAIVNSEGISRGMVVAVSDIDNVEYNKDGYAAVYLPKTLNILKYKDISTFLDEAIYHTNNTVVVQGSDVPFIFRRSSPHGAISLQSHADLLLDNPKKVLNVSAGSLVAVPADASQNYTLEATEGEFKLVFSDDVISIYTAVADTYAVLVPIIKANNIVSSHTLPNITFEGNVSLSVECSYCANISVSHNVSFTKKNSTVWVLNVPGSLYHDLVIDFICDNNFLSTLKHTLSNIFVSSGCFYKAPAGSAILSLPTSLKPYSFAVMDSIPSQLNSTPASSANNAFGHVLVTNDGFISFKNSTNITARLAPESTSLSCKSSTTPEGLTKYTLYDDSQNIIPFSYASYAADPVKFRSAFGISSTNPAPMRSFGFASDGSVVSTENVSPDLSQILIGSTTDASFDTTYLSIAPVETTSKLSPGAIFGIVIACIGAVSIFSFAVIFMVKRKNLPKTAA